MSGKPTKPPEAPAQEPGAEQTPEQNLLDTIEVLKATTVPQADYDKLQETNRRLQNIIRTGSQLDEDLGVEKSHEELVKAVRETAENGTNLAFIESVMELREHVMTPKADGGLGQADPFMPQKYNSGDKHNLETSANNVAELFAFAAERAEGDDAIFSSTLDRYTK